MAPSAEIIDKELQILFGALCDGLCQEERTRQLNSLVSGIYVPLMSYTEPSLTAALSSHLRIVGFPVQTEFSFAHDAALRAVVSNHKLHPDFRIWLPASKRYVYLELKVIDWAKGQRSFASIKGPQGALSDFEKLSKENSSELALNGVAVVGFRATRESGYPRLEEKFCSLADRVRRIYPAYEQIGYERFNVRGIEKRSPPYIVVGLWVRKS